MSLLIFLQNNQRLHSSSVNVLTPSLNKILSWLTGTMVPHSLSFTLSERECWGLFIAVNARCPLGSRRWQYWVTEDVLTTENRQPKGPLPQPKASKELSLGAGKQLFPEAERNEIQADGGTKDIVRNSFPVYEVNGALFSPISSWNQPFSVC